MTNQRPTTGADMMSQEQIIDFYRRPAPLTAAGSHTAALNKVELLPGDDLRMLLPVGLGQIWQPCYRPAGR